MEECKSVCNHQCHKRKTKEEQEYDWNIKMDAKVCPFRVQKICLKMLHDNPDTGYKTEKDYPECKRYLCPIREEDDYSHLGDEE